jgi:cytochrome c oxidase assembly factor CtaG
MRAPSIPQLLVSHWQLHPLLLTETCIVASVYVWAVLRLRARWPMLRTISFLGGMACVVLALSSGLDGYDDRLLSVHMVQHMLLLLIAPLLLGTGRPLLLILRSLRPDRRAPVARAIARLRPFTAPWAALVSYCAVIGLTHLPWFYDLTLTHPALHDLEHASYLLAGSLMLWPLLDADPAPARRLGGLAKLGYMLVAMLPMAIIGAYLNRHTSVVYAPYASAGHALGVSAVNDQALAGAIMWVIGNTIMVGIGLWAVMAALAADERRQQARDSRSARLAVREGPR